MDAPLRDEDLLNALPYAKGYDRELLIDGLGSSEGSEGVAALKRLCLSESGHARSAALWALTNRAGPASTSACVEALRSRSAELQGTAAMILAEHGTADAADAVLAWLDRKLGRPHRTRTWDPYELPSVIRFAVRHDLHARVARVITKRWAALEPDERDWLRRTWPSLIGRDGRPVATDDLAPPAHIQADFYEDERGPIWKDSPDDDSQTHIRKALARASQKARQAHSAGSA